MDLTTRYLGLTLRNPIMVSASPLSQDIDTIKEAQDSGAAGVVCYSLFQEQIEHEQQQLDAMLSTTAESFAEALTYFPEPSAYFNIDAEAYVQHLARLKKALSIPVIGSLNGVSKGGWTKYAKRMEDAGADAIELNIFYVPTEGSLSADDIESMYLESVAAVREQVKIPVAVKLSPFFSSLVPFAKQLDAAGANGLVLFNRFFAPDIDLEALEVTPKLVLSSQNEHRLPLRWIAILFGQIKADLAATSGIHSGEDVLKMIMAGASVTMISSILLECGVSHISTMLKGIETWMDSHEYSSIQQMKGSMSYCKVSAPAAYERANYMKTLQSWSNE